MKYYLLLTILIVSVKAHAFFGLDFHVDTKYCGNFCTQNAGAIGAKNIIKTKGDIGGDIDTDTCFKSCSFSALGDVLLSNTLGYRSRFKMTNMVYSFFANALYHITRQELEMKAQVAPDHREIGGVHVKGNVKYDEFVKAIAQQLLEDYPRFGRKISDDGNDSFLIGDFLPYVNIDYFRSIAKTSSPISKYLNHEDPEVQEAGERLLDALTGKFTDMLRKFKKAADEKYGDPIEINEENVDAELNKLKTSLGEPNSSKGAWYSWVPMLTSCSKGCSSIKQGRKDGEAFTEAVAVNGYEPSSTSFLWCQKNCAPEKYEPYFCGAYDTIGRKDFPKYSKKSLNGIDKKRARVYIEKDESQLMYRCLNYYDKLGGADDKGEVYKYNMTQIRKDVENFLKKKSKKEPTSQDDDDLDIDQIIEEAESEL